MTDFTAVRPHVYTSGAIILAVKHTENETTLYTAHNGAFHATTGHKHTGGTGDGPQLTSAALDTTADFTFSGGFILSSTTKPLRIPKFNNTQQSTYLAGTPVTGDIWYNTSTNQFMGYDGTAARILG